ncbi:MAG: hypothetical protein KC466_00790 [Myxococcales bacterium]|nr:hypothetical protein [Myxococcales bacterium]
MISKIRSALARKEGQGLSEYMIIVALIAVAAIGIMAFAGNTLRTQVSNAAIDLGGGSTQVSATTDPGNADDARGLNDFWQSNN